jgi:membrane protein YdbS with pleckstrin-like domain
MAEAAASGAGDKSGASPEKTIVYAASGGRKTIFSFVFLILLPFFISLPAMLFMRIKHGLLFDAIGLVIMAAAFSILMLLVLIELLASLRMRVELGPDKVKMTLPSGRGPTPMLFYKTHVVPYDQVQSVETRREVYGGSLVPVLLKGARLITKDGKSIPIGYVSEANLDPAFPFPEIAKKIAERARLPLIDRGNVRRSFRRKYFGFKSGGVNEVDTVDEAQIAALNKSHHNVVMGLVSMLVLLIGIGVVHDLMGDTPIGQTASAISPLPAKAPAKK